MKNKIIYINLHNKLALNEAPKTSRALFTLFHLSLAQSYFFVFSSLYPIIGIVPSVVLLAFEYRRKNAYTQSAFTFAYKRLILHISGVIFTGIYLAITVGNIDPTNQAWFLLSYIMLPLAGYDAYCTNRGGLGLNMIRPIQEKIRKGFN